MDESRASVSTSLLDHLRVSTRPLHDRVEKTFDLPARCASVGAYRALLTHLLGFYAPLEESQSSLDWRGAGLDFDARRKAHLLRADLAALGGDPAAPAAGAGLPVCRRLPRPATLAGGIGCQYVLEGATLGGQILAREIRRSLDIGPENGGRFYAGYQEETGRMWRAFCSAAERYCGDDPRRREEALAQAIETFESLDAWLRGPK